MTFGAERGVRLFLACVLTALAGSSVPARQTGAGQAPAQAPVTPTAGQPQDRQRQPSFTAGIDVVSLNVTATDGENRYVIDLATDDFSVFEDGVKQDISFFDRSNQPIALALLIDTSASMEERLATAQEAAIGFAKRLRSQDVAEVIDFDSRVDIVQTFTNDIGELERAIRQTVAGGSTSLHNAIYISLKELKKMQARSPDEVRRQAIVVLSDGEDTSSLVSFEEVLELAKRSETAIYAIGLRGRDIASTKGFHEAEFVLRQLAQESGGRVFFPNQASELESVYGQIAQELSSQYILGYTSKNLRRDGAWRRVVVRVERPSIRTRTKQGYYAPTSH